MTKIIDKTGKYRFKKDMVVKKTTIFFIILSTLLLSIPAAYEPGHFAKTLFVGAFVISFSISIIVAWATRKHLKIRMIFTLIILLLFALETYVFICYQSRFDPNILTLILQTNSSEVFEFCKVYLLSAKSLVAIATLTLSCYLLYRFMLIKGSISVCHPLFLKYFILTVVATGIYVAFVPLPFPIGNNTLAQFYQAWKFVISRHGEVNNMAEAIDHIKVYSSHSSQEAPVIVLVIGESFNKNHSSLYGYSLSTSPYLSSEKENGNLLLFTHAQSPTNGTDNAMRYIFSLKGCRGDNSQSNQFVLMPAVFKKAGYKVAYLDNQYTRSTGGRLDYSCGYFLNPARINSACFDYRNNTICEYDGDFIRLYKNRIYTHPQSFVIIHLKGQHFDAKLRYPSCYDYFKASDIKRCQLSYSQKEQVAAYDNATRYNDFVLSLIINLFKKRDAVIVYLSDHGEQIYDGPHLNFGRGYPNNDRETIRNVYNVPFMVWCSNSFIKRHSEKYNALRHAVSRPICTADVSFMLFDLADINFNYNNKNRSAISPSFVPHRVVRD